VAENKTKATKKSVSAFINALQPEAKRAEARTLVNRDGSGRSGLRDNRGLAGRGEGRAVG
jgi:hypothetical protein